MWWFEKITGFAHIQCLAWVLKNFPLQTGPVVLLLKTGQQGRYFKLFGSRSGPEPLLWTRTWSGLTSTSVLELYNRSSRLPSLPKPSFHCTCSSVITIKLDIVTWFSVVHMLMQIKQQNRVIDFIIRYRATESLPININSAFLIHLNLEMILIRWSLALIWRKLEAFHWEIIR